MVSPGAPPCPAPARQPAAPGRPAGEHVRLVAHYKEAAEARRRAAAAAAAAAERPRLNLKVRHVFSGAMQTVRCKFTKGPAAP